MIIKGRRHLIVKIIYGIIAALMILLIIRSYAGLIYGTFVTNIPGEYMDVANVQISNDIVKGINPYVFKDNPVDNYIYAYTPLNSVLSAVISFTTGFKAFRTHYILTFLWVTLSALLLSLYIHKKTDNKIFALLTFMMMLTVIQRNCFVSISTVPDMLGVFVSVLILVLIDNKEEITNIKLITVIFLSVLLFYIKQYYVIFAITVFIYLCMNNYKKAIAYVIGCLVLGLTSLYIINYFCPLFTTQTIYCFLNSDGEVEAANDSGFKLSIEQMGKIVKYYAPLLLVYVFVICRKIVRLVARIIDRRFAYKYVDEAEILKPSIFDINTFIMFFVLLLYLGRHDGAYLSYHLQLMIPSLIAAALLGINNINMEVLRMRNDKLLAMKFSEFISKGNTFLWGTVFAISVLGIVYCMYTDIRIGKAPIYTEEDKANWESAYEEMSQYKSDEILVLAPSVGYYCLDKNIPVIGNGHNYMRGMEDGIDRSLIVVMLEKMGLMSHLDEYYQVATKRREMILNGINNKDYKLVIVPEGGYLYFDADEEGYSKFRTYTLRTGYEYYNIAFYKAN